MLGRASSSTRARRPRLPDMIGEYPLGKETGLPLIICEHCRLRVLELVAQTDENGNKGRVFFKCPRNIQGIPESCGFYPWQREYLALLVRDGKIGMNLGHQTGAMEEEVDSRAVARVVQQTAGREEEAYSRALVRVPVQKTPTEEKLDALIGAVKTLGFVMGAGVFVGAVYVMK